MQSFAALFFFVKIWRCGSGMAGLYILFLHVGVWKMVFAYLQGVKYKLYMMWFQEVNNKRFEASHEYFRINHKDFFTQLQ